MSSTNRFRK
jgi:hypothetical protein